MMDGARELLRPVLHTRVGRRARREFIASAMLFQGLVAFDRPAWLYRSRGAVPATDVHFRTPRPVDAADLALSRRLIDAYALAREGAPAPSGMWSHPIFRDRQRELVRALEQRDASALAGRLASMLRSDAIVGMALGSVGVTAVSRLSPRLSYLLTLSKLVALAESQRAVRAENPEQGVAGAVFADGVESLIANTEAAIGVPLDFPDVGAAYGIRIAGRLITRDTPDQIYAAARLRDAMRTHLAGRDSPLSVVEIGAGYGAMAYWLLQMIDSRYVIVDLPIVNVLQGYFLSKALGESEVSLYGESPGRVSISPAHDLSNIDAPFDVLVNKDSMPEIPETALIEYLSWARTGCTGIFYSYNQEAAAPYAGTSQNVVREVLARVGGFHAVRRDTSWLRRGYVEEIYKVSAARSRYSSRRASLPQRS